ncbi:hypothetical protein DXG01_014429 [Tephrocybe rancida]|nr:hypothetical protein DXG01_014429 [Tephrocybe rancida]
MHESIPLLSYGLKATCHSSDDVKATVYAQIECDIASMQKAIRELKTRHNSLSLTARLPPDLLGNIFKWLASMERKNPSTPWVKVSFVCSHWRRTALSCPALWCFVRNLRPGWVAALIARSGVLPLCVNLAAFRSTDKQGLQMVLGDMDRVRKFIINGPYLAPYQADQNHVIHSMIRPVPLLECLIIDFESRTSPMIYFPDHAFADHTPHLRTVQLKNCMFRGPYVTQFTALRSLTLDVGSSNDRDWAALHLLLSHTPNITTLKITIGSPFKPLFVPRAQPVQLLALEHLSIDCCSTPDLVVLNSSLNHPIATNLTFHANSDSSRSASEFIDSARTLLRAAILSRGPVPLHRLIVRPEDRLLIFVLNADSAARHLVELQLGRGRHHNVSNTELLKALLELIPMAELKELQLADDAPPLRSFWTPTFGDSNLRSIKISGVPTPLVEALLNDAEGPIAIPSEDAISSFRSLKTLQIRKWTFNKSEIGIFKSWLQNRRSQGLELQRLHIQGKFVTTDTAEIGEQAGQLEALVQEFTWDVQVKLVKVGSNKRRW